MNLRDSKETGQDFAWLRQNSNGYFLSKAENFCEILASKTKSFLELRLKLQSLTAAAAMIFSQIFARIMEDIPCTFHMLRAIKVLLC